MEEAIRFFDHVHFISYQNTAFFNLIGTGILLIFMVNSVKNNDLFLMHDMMFYCSNPHKSCFFVNDLH